MKTTIPTHTRWSLRFVPAALAASALGCCVCPHRAGAQTADSAEKAAMEPAGSTATAESLPAAPEPANEAPSLLGTPKRIGLDLVGFLQSPAHIHGRDAKWLLPLTAAAATSFAVDEYTMQHVVTTNASTNSTSGTVSDGLRYGFIGVPILMYGAGLTRHDEHLRETGLLGGEGMVDAAIAGTVIKLATFRERPGVDNSEGSFYRTSSGYNSSFISGHSLTAWSSAAVIASEYPNKWVQVGAYTAATGVSLARVLAQEHFPSDVLLGSAAGWLIGRYVYRHHAHDGLRGSLRRSAVAEAK